MPAPTPDGEPQDPRPLGGQLQPARHRHGHARGLRHHGPEASASKPLLHAVEHALLVSAFDHDDAVIRQPNLSKGRQEQIPLRDTPENFPLCARCHPGDEQGCCRTVERTVPAACDFMQAAKGKPPARQMPVDLLDAKGQKLLLSNTGAGYAIYTFAKLFDSDGWRAMLHGRQVPTQALFND